MLITPGYSVVKQGKNLLPTHKFFPLRKVYHIYVCSVYVCSVGTLLVNMCTWAACMLVCRNTASEYVCVSCMHVGACFLYTGEDGQDLTISSRQWVNPAAIKTPRDSIFLWPPPLSLTPPPTKNLYLRYNVIRGSRGQGGTQGSRGQGGTHPLDKTLAPSIFCLPWINFLMKTCSSSKWAVQCI